jgi:molybdopterin/thiamine biosynthesis adenylyltransferase
LTYLGCGGLGCTVALDLVRLGVKKIILLDKDTVDYHNLNRQVSFDNSVACGITVQILFSREDIGKPKVEMAKNMLERHNLRTEIVTMRILMNSLHEISRMNTISML